MHEQDDLNLRVLRMFEDTLPVDAAQIVQRTLVTTTSFVPKDVAIKMNLLLYSILNDQIDM